MIEIPSTKKDHRTLVISSDLRPTLDSLQRMIWSALQKFRAIALHYLIKDVVETTAFRLLETAIQKSGRVEGVIMHQAVEIITHRVVSPEMVIENTDINFKSPTNRKIVFNASSLIDLTKHHIRYPQFSCPMVIHLLSLLARAQFYEPSTAREFPGK